MDDPGWFDVGFWQDVVVQGFSIVGALGVGLAGLQVQYNRERQRRLDDAKRARLMPDVEASLSEIRRTLRDLSQHRDRTTVTAATRDQRLLLNLGRELLSHIETVNDTEVYNYLNRVLNVLFGARTFLAIDVVVPAIDRMSKGEDGGLTDSEKERYDELATDVWKVLRSVFTGVHFWEQGGPLSYLYSVPWEKRSYPSELWGDKTEDKRDIKAIRAIYKAEQKSPHDFFTDEFYPPMPDVPKLPDQATSKLNKRQQWLAWWRTRPTLAAKAKPAAKNPRA